MVKKNTLLYLDEQLVKKAKELKLNLSEIAENALKEHMFPMLSLGKRVAIDFNSYLKILEKDGKCFFLPFQIKKIHIKNIGIHSNLKLNFGAFNILEDYHGSGKTTVVRSIAKTFGYDSTSYQKLLSTGQNPHQISITIKPENKIDITFDEQNQDKYNENRTTRSIILDEPMSRLSSNLKNEFLRYLIALNTQIILTNTPQDMGEYPDEYKIHRLKPNK